jgi:enoyl-CoA hydratase/carnithine racemase
MSEIVTEQSGSILRIQLNRPEKKNAMTSLPFDATRARELGIVTRVVPDEKLLATAMETAQQLAAKPAGALRACKRLLKRSAREPLEQAMREENAVFSTLVRSADAREALTAFLEKRPPHFNKSKEGVMS